MTVHVYIDSCAWNFLFRAGVDLKSELPPELYKLHLTRQIEIELAAIPCIGKDGKDNRDLKRYIATNTAQGEVTTTGTFGFQTLEPDGTPSKVQTYVGFGQGTFQSDQESAYYASQEVRAQIIGKRATGSGLSVNQGDASLAVHATSSVVLTDESPAKTGPLKLAASKGGKIVYLSAQFEPSGLSLGAYLASI
jgi:hypothetical protein